jgi:Fe-S-cluster-containing dehydrogenase component/DMSO reductase anchor subunit
MHVCPSTATRRRPDGIVTIDYDICIGCAYCDVACPYQARFKIDDAALANEIEREDERRIGVAQKCTYCSDRIDFGLANGLTPGLDPAATPACVNSCIADALHFGDLDDPVSNVSRLLREQRTFRMHEELGTQPRFYYAYGRAEVAGEAVPSPRSDVLNPSPALQGRAAARSAAGGGRATAAEPAATHPTRLASLATLPFQGRDSGSAPLRTRGVAPWHQQHWDWKAAGNFICGGAGAGLFIAAATQNVTTGTSVPLAWPALAIVALGLFLVLLKIGRPLRFIHVLRQPQRSWMTREAWIAMLLFPLGALATWLESAPLMLAAALLAACYLFSQAMILRECKGIPAWRTPRIVPLIIATGLAEGVSLALIAGAATSAPASITRGVALLAVILAAIRAWSWSAYLGALRSEGAPARTIAVLENFARPFLLLGLALPAVLIVPGWIIPNAPLFALAGFFIAGAGAALKFVLVTRAGYNQGFALPHLPARGADAPGISFTGVKPGWAME